MRSGRILVLLSPVRAAQTSSYKMHSNSGRSVTKCTRRTLTSDVYLWPATISPNEECLVQEKKRKVLFRFLLYPVYIILACNKCDKSTKRSTFVDIRRLPKTVVRFAAFIYEKWLKIATNELSEIESSTIAFVYEICLLNLLSSIFRTSPRSISLFRNPLPIYGRPSLGLQRAFSLICSFERIEEDFQLGSSKSEFQDNKERFK